MRRGVILGSITTAQRAGNLASKIAVDTRLLSQGKSALKMSSDAMDVMSHDDSVRLAQKLPKLKPLKPLNVDDLGDITRQSVAARSVAQALGRGMPKWRPSSRESFPRARASLTTRPKIGNGTPSSTAIKR